MTELNHIYSSLRQRLSFVYALLIGVVGVLVLVWLLQYQTMSFDLSALLPFAVLSIVVSYFHIPVGRDNAELSVDGVILLGAMLTGGPVIGGWAAFITGLVVSILPQSKRLTPELDWVEQVALAALNSGRNVIAIGAAWLTFYWLGGMLNPSSLTPTVSFALLLMCVVYALIRLFLIWLLTLFASSKPLQSFFLAANASQFLIELLPLPIALIFSPLFVRAVWTRFLTLALIFIGSGALMRRMVEQIHTSQDRIETLRLRLRIERAFSTLPSSIFTLCNLAHQFCQEIVQARCEIGVFNDTLTQVNIQVSAGEKTHRPSMHIPMTAFWSWIGSLNEAQIVPTQTELALLPFPLPKMESGLSPRSAVLLAIHDRESTRRELIPSPLGGIILLSESSYAFDEASIERLTLLADLAGTAIRRLRANPIDMMETDRSPIVRHIQQGLLPDAHPAFSGWQIGSASALSSLSNGAWFDWYPAQPAWSFYLSEPLSQGLRGVLLSTIVHAFLHTVAHQDHVEPLQLIQTLNNYLLSFNQQTLFLYVTSDQENLLTWVNAGCPSPLWWHHAQSRVEALSSTTPVLGAETYLDIEATSIALESGDAFVVCTQGVIEASYEGEAFQERHLTDTIRQHAHLPADALAQTIIEQVQEFVHHAPLEQDALVIVFKPDST